MLSANRYLLQTRDMTQKRVHTSWFDVSLSVFANFFDVFCRFSGTARGFSFFGCAVSPINEISLGVEGSAGSVPDFAAESRFRVASLRTKGEVWVGAVSWESSC